MNKILLNQKGRNHIKVMLLKDSELEMPVEDAEKIHFCEKLFINLQHDDNAIRHFYYRNTKKGYQITVYESNDKIYLTNCIRDMEGNYITTIYVSKNLNDLKGIAKMLKENIQTIMSDYKMQIIEGKDAFKDYIEDCEVKA